MEEGGAQTMIRNVQLRIRQKLFFSGTPLSWRIFIHLFAPHNRTILAKSTKPNSILTKIEPPAVQDFPPIRKGPGAATGGHTELPPGGNRGHPRDPIHAGDRRRKPLIGDSHHEFEF